MAGMGGMAWRQDSWNDMEMRQLEWHGDETVGMAWWLGWGRGNVQLS